MARACRGGSPASVELDVGAIGLRGVDEGVDVSIEGLVKSASLIVPGTRCPRGSPDDFGPTAVKLDLGDIAMPEIRGTVPKIPGGIEVYADFGPAVRGRLGDGIKYRI